MYQNLSEEEKYKCQNGHEHYKNFPENDKGQLSIEKVILECKKLINT